MLYSYVAQEAVRQQFVLSDVSPPDKAIDGATVTMGGLLQSKDTSAGVQPIRMHMCA